MAKKDKTGKLKLQKKFDGKIFDFSGGFNTKQAAKNLAKELKQKGYYVRIKESPKSAMEHGVNYDVFKRKKPKKETGKKIKVGLGSGNVPISITLGPKLSKYK